MTLPCEAPEIPASVAILPFLFMRSRADDSDWIEATALAAASAAERAVDEPGNSRKRLAWLICEFDHQQVRRTGRAGASLPLTPQLLAQTLGIGLARVKRILALLRLSEVIETDAKSLRVTDWMRLCSLAGYDRARLALGETSMEEDLLLAALDDQPRTPALTCTGDPACFE